MHAREALDLGSRAEIFFGTTPGRTRTELSMSGNFWSARVYATDGGGEAVRLTIGMPKTLKAFARVLRGGPPKDVRGKVRSASIPPMARLARRLSC